MLLGLLLRLLRNVLLLPFIVVVRLRRPPEYVVVRLKDSPPYRPPPLPLRFQMETASVEDLARLVDHVLAEPMIRGVVLDVGPLSCGLDVLFALRAEVDRLRKAGKATLAMLRQADNREYYVATGAATVAMTEATPFTVHPLAVQATFLGEAMRRAHLVADLERAGRFKGATEPFTRDGPSEEFREAATSVVDSLSEDFAARVAAGRGFEVGRARAAIEAGPYTAEGARSAGLVDEFLYPDEVAERLATGKDRKAILTSERFFRNLPRWRTVRFLPVVALIPVRGILRTEPAVPSPCARGWTAEATRRFIEKAVRNPRVRSIVVIIDSRGGSAVASDILWRAILRARKVKPVVAYLGEVAASGGYFAAAAASVIVATPGTLTGSIGVMGGKFVVGDLLRHLGIRQEVFARSSRGGIFSSSRQFHDDEREWLRRELEAVYRLFVRKVAEGRGLREEEVETVAQGRVWTGAQALERRLVDLVGSLSDALAEARQLAGLPRDAEVWLVSPRPRPGWWETMAAGLPGGGAGARGRARGPEAGEGETRPLASGASPALLGRHIEELLEVQALLETERVLAYSPIFVEVS